MKHYDPCDYPDPNYMVPDANTVLNLTMNNDCAVETVFKCGGGVDQALPLLVLAVAVCGFAARRMR